MCQIGSIVQDKELVEKDSTSISVRQQCKLLGINRNKIYYQSKGESEENLQLMSIMDKHLLEYPTEGVISMVHYLADHGYQVNPKRIRRLFRLMGHETVYRVKNLTKLGKAEYIRPYLLRKLEIQKANQVWCTDITYIPMRHGSMYLTAIMDIYSRKILSWSISNTMTTEWCLETLNEAISKYGTPEIINSDQGSQYTSKAWTELIEKQDIKVSMDGKGRATDNTWIERFWKTIKVNHIYLRPAENGLDLLQGVANYIEYYNSKTHQTTNQKPSERYSDSISKMAA